MRWFRKPTDLSLSNEYQELTRGGCINCGALLEVLKSVTGYNSTALHDILSKMPYVGENEEGCWAYAGRSDTYPACLGRLKDDAPKVIQARNEIVRAREAIAATAAQYKKERAKRFREVENRRLP